MAADSRPASEELAPATNFLSLGAELLSEVQRIVGPSKVTALRIKLGDRVIKRIPLAPVTVAATVMLVIVAVLVSTMSIEVEHEPTSATA